MSKVNGRWPLTPDLLENPEVPDAQALDTEDVQKIFGWADNTRVSKNIGTKLPPPFERRPLLWTVGQIRDWRVRRGILENRKAIRREEECAKLADEATLFEKAALA